MERPHVAGNSLGGLIALQLAVRGQVRSATALSPAGFATVPEMTVTRASLWVSVRAARALAGQADRLLAPALGHKLALNLFVSHPERMTPADAAASTRALAAAPWFDATLPSSRADHRRPRAGGTRAARGGGYGPVATGREGSAIHSLHEPGYSAAAIPASSSASTWWAAVTPDPQ